MKIAHIVNPVKVGEDSDLYIAQPVTFASMEAARRFSAPEVDVSFFTTQYPEDRCIIPREFVPTPDLERSISDIGAFKIPRKFPLIKDILDRLYHDTAGEHEYLIYTNVDIALQPYFYRAVSLIAARGYDAFVITRRTIPGTYRHPGDLPLMYGEAGDPHKGWDCFVFKRSLYPRFRLGTACIGMGWIGRVLISNMAALARKFRVFTDLHLTFHIGNEKSWKSGEYSDYMHHNREECRKILEAFDREAGPLDREKFPGRFFRFLENTSQTPPKRFCSHPFNKVHLALNGNVFVCCSAWLNRPIGNLFNQSFDDIWNSQTAREIRASILDESFKFCRADRCPRMVSGIVEEEARQETFRHIMEEKKVVIGRGPGLMSLNYDNSCNLYCESCRNELYVTDKETRGKLIRFQERLLTSDYFKQVKRITVSGTGEALASPVYMDLFSRISSDEYPDLKITLRTNGLLLTPHNWERIKNIHYALDIISISIDAAKAKTYRRLRRGGDFKRLLKNLAFLKELKQTNPFTLILHFVVQKANYREMPHFVKLAKKYNCDRVAFAKLFNLGTYSPESYQELAVHLPANPEFARFKEILKDPAIKDPMVHLKNLPRG